MLLARSLLSAPLLFALASVAHAADAFADFSTTANPNGAWRYGYDAGAGFTAFPSFSAAPGGGMGWRDASVDPYLGVYRYATSVLQHPGAIGQHSDLRYVAAVTGGYVVSIAFSNGDNATTDVALDLTHNAATSVLASGAVNGASAPTPYVATLSLSAGDVLDSLVGYGSNGTNVQDSTYVRFTVTPVPEPSALAALGLGAVALFRRRRK